MTVGLDNIAIAGLNPFHVLRERYYANGNLGATTLTALDKFDQGVYRVQLTDPDCDYSRVDVDILKVYPFLRPNMWNDDLLSNPAFTSKTATQFIATGLTGGKYAVSPQGVFAVLQTQTFHATLTAVVAVTGSSTASVGICFLDSSGVLINCETFSGLGNGTHELEFEFSPSGSDAEYINIQVNEVGTGSVDVTVTIPEYWHLGEKYTETKTLDIDCGCLRNNVQGYNLSWLNNTGGYDHWYFKAYSDYLLDIQNTGETSVNIFPNWPSSYGEFADTKDRKQTFRDSVNQILLRSQHLTQEQVDIVSKIKTSNVVQIVNSIYDRRTVIVDKNSFTKRKESDKLYEISFVVTFTDNVASQRV
jgi:hypothetical protein